MFFFFWWLYRAAGIVGWGSELSELQVLGKRLHLLLAARAWGCVWHPTACVEFWLVQGWGCCFVVVSGS